MLQFTALWKKAQMNREWTKQASLLIQGKITYFVQGKQVSTQVWPTYCLASYEFGCSRFVTLFLAALLFNGQVIVVPNGTIRQWSILCKPSYHLPIYHWSICGYTNCHLPVCQWSIWCKPSYHLPICHWSICGETNYHLPNCHLPTCLRPKFKLKGGKMFFT